MGRPKGSTNKKITTKEEAIKKEKQRLYMAKWKEKKKLEEAVWTESYQTQVKEPVLLDEAVSVPEGPQRDEKGKFLPGHKATRNVRNPFKKMLDSIILENPENFKKFEQTIEKLLIKSSEGELQAISILFKYLMPGIAEHGLEAIGKIRTSTAAELSESMDKVIGHMAEGEISPEAANNYLRCLSVKREFMQLAVMEEKLAAIEQRLTTAGK